jgi:hypothetical protein
MAKSGKRKSSKNSFMKNIKSTTKIVVDNSIPVIDKSVGAVYGTMAKGLDLGVKGVKNVTKSVGIKSRSASRSLALAGGRRTRRRRRH